MSVTADGDLGLVALVGVLGDSSLARRILLVMTKLAVTRRHLPSSPFKPPVTRPPKEFAIGDRVTHDEYGLGRVIGIEGETAVLVDFGSLQARIMSPYGKLAKL